MSKKFFLTAWVLGLGYLAQAQAADVGVSINIGQPGFYGQVDIGHAPRPRLIYSQPVLIERTHVQAAPVYIRVPPGHERSWRKHCRHYEACGRPVYFVRDDWYRDEFVPHYRHSHSERHGDGWGREGERGYERAHGRDRERHGHGRDRD